MRRMPRRLLALLALLAVASVASATIAQAATPSGDLALAKRLRLRLTDLPFGWQQSPGASAPSGCFDGPVQAGHPTAYLRSARFQNPTNIVNVASTVAVFPTAAVARRALAAVSKKTVFACYGKALATSLPAGGARLASFQGAPFAFGRLGDELRAFRYGAQVTKGSNSGTITFDFIFVLRGRALISGAFVNESYPLAPAGERGVFANVLARD
jgi:hypothetical protein